MLSKFILSTRATTQMAARSFKTSQVLSEKLKIGDAVKILQNQVSKISQVVSKTSMSHFLE